MTLRPHSDPQLPSIPYFPSNPNPSSHLSLPPRPPNQRNPIKKLTDAKLQAKIAKGLGFRCDAKYSSGHRCQNKKLQVLLVQEESLRAKLAKLQGIETPLEDEVEEIAELSVNSIVELSAPRTMKIKGKIGQQEVINMIDCGATHNFIFATLVQLLGLPRETTANYGVLIGTSVAVKGEGICWRVPLSLQNIHMERPPRT